MKLEELDALCEQFLEQRQTKARAEENLKEIKSQLKKTEGKILAALEDNDSNKYAGKFGTFTKVQRQYYKCLDKEQTYRWIKERGEFDDLATIAANTLSSYVKNLIEQKIEEEKDFTWLPPGMEDSSSDRTYLKHTP